jgi:hypothetical protein
MNWLSKLFAKNADDFQRVALDSPPLGKIFLPGQPELDITAHLHRHLGYPIFDWASLMEWVQNIRDETLQAEAWLEIERTWLNHFRIALGSDFHLAESSNVLLISSLDSNAARATLSFMDRTLVRIAKILDGITSNSSWGKDILLIFDDADSYYRYISYYYPDAGEFAQSGGIHIASGCSHYATIKSDLHSIEPVIAHEMTHDYLSHLPLPAWLNEGIAVSAAEAFEVLE